MSIKQRLRKLEQDTGTEESKLVFFKWISDDPNDPNQWVLAAWQMGREFKSWGRDKNAESGDEFIARVTAEYEEGRHA